MKIEVILRVLANNNQINARSFGRNPIFTYIEN